MAGVPAGRLSIEIVAGIARLQKDLDAAKRQVRAASKDIGISAKAANDNIAGMGRAMGGVTTMSRGMRASMINLGRQVQDVGTMFALGAPPMQIFASQGAQIADVLAMMKMQAREADTSLTAMARGGLARFGPYALAAAAAVGVMAVAVNRVGENVEKASGISVTAGDVMLGTFDAIAAGVSGVVTDSFDRFGVDVGAVWDWIIDKTIWTADRIIGVLSYPTRAIGEAWSTFPAAMGDLFYMVVNGAIAAAETIANVFIHAYNNVKNASNYLFDTGFSDTALINLERFQNDYAGSMGVFFEGQGRALGETFTGNFIDEFSSYAGDFITARARQRMAEEAEEAGKAAGKAAKDATQKELAKLFDDVFADLAREVDRINQVRDENRSAKERLEILENEARVLGLVGWERERMLLSLEHQAQLQRTISEIAAAEAANQLDLADQLRKRAEIMQDIYDQQIRNGDAEEAWYAHEDAITELADLYEELFTGGIDNVWDVFKRQGLAAISQIAAQWTLSLLAGNDSNTQANNPLAALFGGSVFGAANDNGPIGAAGSAASAASAGGLFGGGFGGGSALSSVAGPVGLAVAGVQLSNFVGQGIGSVLGTGYDKKAGGLFGIVGGLIGGIFGGSKKGGVTINGSDILSSFGKDKYQQNGLSAADSIFSSLAQIADALGAEINGNGRVSIGERKGDIRVDPYGLGSTKTGKGAIDFGQDLNAAIEFALRDLITDGVLGGISRASQNILAKSGDLEAAIEKAVLIESIPKLLSERLDPLSGALDEIDKQFQTLADALREGGATAQQFADAEKLYNLERQDALAQYGQAANTLQEYLDSLAFGSNSPLSVRSQLSAARNDFAKFEAAIIAGEAIDQNAFTASAQSLLGLSRQANASSNGFFADFDRIRELTQLAIENVDSSALNDGSVVFAQQTASATQGMARMMEDQNVLLREQNALLRGSNDNGPNNRGSWIAQQRAF